MVHENAQNRYKGEFQNLPTKGQGFAAFQTLKSSELPLKIGVLNPLGFAVQNKGNLYHDKEKRGYLLEAGSLVTIKREQVYDTQDYSHKPALTVL